MDRTKQKDYVQELVSKSFRARRLPTYDQARVNEPCAAVAWECIKRNFRRTLPVLVERVPAWALSKTVQQDLNKSRRMGDNERMTSLSAHR